MKFPNILALAVAACAIIAGCGGGGGAAGGSGKLLVTAGNSGVHVYSLAANGVPSLVAAEVDGVAPTIAPGRTPGTVYVFVSGANVIAHGVYANGAIVFSDAGQGPSGPAYLFKHPSKNVLYAVSPVDDAIYQYSMNTNGVLLPMVPPFVATGNTPTSLVFTPDGNSAYVSCQGSDSIRRFSVGVSGALTSQGDVAAGDQPTRLLMSDDGVNLYAMSLSQNFAQFTVNANGTLTALAAGSYPMGNMRAVITPDSVVAFYREADEGIETLVRSGNGTLTNPNTTNLVTNSVTSLYRLPIAGRVLALTQTGSARVVTINANGTFGTVLDTTVATGITDATVIDAP